MPIEGDFYEDDEPLEKIIDIWERSPKGVTSPPAPLARGFNGFVQLGSEWMTLHATFGSVTTILAAVGEPILDQPLSR